MRILNGLVVLLLLSSCGANKVWVRDNTSQYQAQQDLNACNYDAVKYGHVDMWGSGIGAGIEQGIRENRIVTSCMASKGYYLTTQDQISARSDSHNNPSDGVHIETHTSLEMACRTDLDCSYGESCRSKKGGGSECRVKD